jgi:hypothetical protein
MATKPDPLDISDSEGLAELAEKVQTHKKSFLLRRGSEDLAVIQPARRPRKPIRRARPVMETDSIFDLIGIGKSNIPGGISGRKHEYLAQSKRSQ